MTTELRTSQSVVSVCSRAELSYAEVFAESFRRHHPDIAISLLVLDGSAAELDTAVMRRAGVRTLSLHDIFEDTHRRLLIELWDQASLRVVCQPYLLESLLATNDQLVFLPIRTWFLAPCPDLFEVLQRASFSLAPVLPMSSMLESAGDPGDSLFQLDFTAVRSDEHAGRFLRRWKHFIGRNQVLNFVHANTSALSEAFEPLPETTSYCTYRDAQHRHFTLSASRELIVNNEPVGSFTFQKDWEPSRPAADIGQVPLRVIHSAYASELVDRDLSATEHRPYGHDLGHDGTPITPWLREVMREHASGYRQGDSSTSILEYIATPRAGGTPLAISVWNRRPDLREKFHDVEDPAFLAWLTTEGDRELGLHGLLRSRPNGDRTLHDLMQDLVARDDLRATHPQAFTTKEGARWFATWLVDRGVVEYPGSERAIAALLSRLGDMPIDGAALVYQTRNDVQSTFPWAMTAAQSNDYIDWIQSQGVDAVGLDQFQLDAFAFGVGQLWVQDLQSTWRRNRQLQRRFPLALSIFDQGEFKQFAVDSLTELDPEQDWTFIAGLDLTTQVSPLLQLRCLWAATSELRDEIPEPFARGASERLAELVEAVEPTLMLCGADDEWRAELDEERTELAKRQNLTVRYLGLSRGFTGLGVAARGHAHALRSADVDVFEQPIGVGQKLIGAGADHTNEQFCNATIIHCNDDLVDEAIAQGADALFPGSIVIGYAVWELEEYEPRLDWGRRVTEIWTPSSFSATSISRQVSVPVQVVPHPIAPPRPADPQRSQFGFSDTDVVFGFCADAKSRLERKNVAGLIDAFKIAHHSAPDSRLLLKISDPGVDPAAIHDLRERAAGLPVRFLFDDLTDHELAGVVETMDCYVSLHRSEGFGLTLAEAMARGKPVIATGYSGNTEFMNVANSYPVRYDLKPSTQADGFFGAVNWAHADVDHAATLMAHVVQNPEDAKAIGQRAAVEISEQLSPARIGQLMRARLMLLSKRTQGEQ